MRAHAPLQIPRALIVTSAVLGIAAAAHTAGGGQLPPAPVLALLASLILAPVTLLSRRQLGLPAMLGILSAGQGILHAAFTGLSAPAGQCTAPGTAVHGHHQTFAIPDCATAGPTVLASHHASEATGALMFAAHALAVAATALLLARGEAALWQLLAWFRPLAVILRPAPLPVGARIPVLLTGMVPVQHPGLRIPTLRGPPTYRAAFAQAA